jgi:predicted MPP superfamily phosphohydrolase
MKHPFVLLTLFKFILAFILLAIQFYFYRGIRILLTTGKPHRRLLIVARIAFLLFSLPVFIAIFWIPFVTPLPALWVLLVFYPFYCWHLTWVLMFILTAAGELLGMLLRLVRRLGHITGGPGSRQTKFQQAHQPTRRAFLRQASITTAGVIFSGAAYGAFAHDQYELTKITIPLSRLPASFEGYTIALLSDIHSSIFMTKEMMTRYVGVTNELGANLIVVTGDFVNSLVEEVYPFAEAFSQLRAPDGVFGVLGNHDYYTRNVELIAGVVNQCGIRLLRNEHTLLRRGEERITLAGVDDVPNGYTARELFARSARGCDEERLKLLLCHRPYFFREAAEQRFDLTLAGHTHGGQIVMARFGGEVVAPARLASPYVAGLYTKEESRLYVSRGIGTVAVPIRINCPPEVTLITLVRG